MSKKSNLFKFVTLRNPQLLDEDRKEQGFVKYENESSSYFNTAASGSGSARYTALKTASGTFAGVDAKAFVSRSDLHAEFPKLTKFASWLSKNKNKLTVANVNEAVSSTGVDLISADGLQSIWDNLIYQTISETSKTIRVELIRLLIAESFYKKYRADILLPDPRPTSFTEEQEREFKRRAKANVILTPRFLPDVTKTVTMEPKLSSALINRLDEEMKAAIAEENSRNLKNQLVGLKLEEKANLIQLATDFKTEATAYKAAIKAYKSDSSNQVEETITLADGTTETVITYPTIEDDVVFTVPTLTPPSAQVIDEGAVSEADPTPAD